MMSQEEVKILADYIAENALRNTHQRFDVLDVFINSEGHFSIEELHELVKKKYPQASFSSTFRAMQVIEKAGLAARISGVDGVFRFEHLYKHQNHGHLVCTQCGQIIEYDNSKIIKLQKKIAAVHHFEPIRFGAKVRGICRNCQVKR
ncbi:ferric uptake regulation protein [Candidatus Termititenax persephonae]|uniref:Ferric uptake regulation protein n=1 Tax=Candidatus Termititenax persephonae TaxID=2218525 RepID=A0A388TFZ7_9BACT|nr:ferric uptake regulation protein [Candidatus Termititenax persephonae]